MISRPPQSSKPRAKSRVPVHTRVIAALQDSPHPIWGVGLINSLGITQKDLDRLVKNGFIVRSFAPRMAHEPHGHATYALPFQQRQRIDADAAQRRARKRSEAAQRNPKLMDDSYGGRKSIPADAHPAYFAAVKQHGGYIDYAYWLERLAPYDVKRAVQAKVDAEKWQALRAHQLTAEDRRMMATERAEEAHYGRRMRAGFQRENPVVRVLRATLAERVALAKQEILADVAAGNVPRMVRSFAKLHDYTDANGYGGWFRDEDPKWGYRSFADVPMANAVSEEIERWIKAGGLRGKANPRR